MNLHNKLLDISDQIVGISHQGFLKALLKRIRLQIC
jgi:hypothetical protein